MSSQVETCAAALSAIGAEAGQRFGALSGEQLNWKPAADSWSVAQCLDHIMTINRDYLPMLAGIARDGYTPSLYQRMPLLPGFFGAMILKAVSPSGSRKFKAAAKFAPSSSAIGHDVVQRFVAHQEEMINAMRSVAHVNLTTTIVTSPVAPIAIYSLADALQIIVAHEQRHMGQAARVLSAPGFPR